MPDGDGSVLMKLGSLPPAQPGPLDLRQREPAVRWRVPHGHRRRDRPGRHRREGRREARGPADTIEAGEEAFAEASEREGLSVIVSKVEAG